MRKQAWQSETAQAVREATGLRDAVQGAILLAERFTSEYGITHSAQHLDMLASCLDARIERSSMQEAGQLVPTLSGPTPFLILVNQDHSPRRQNFSICHEFGHLLMPNYSPFSGRRVDWETMSWSKKDEEEYLCDTAAAEILMPRRIFKPRLRGCGLSIEAIDEMAEEFEVSLEATAVNIVRAGLDDVAVIIWEKGYNKRDAASLQNLSLFSEDESITPAPIEKKFRVKFACTYGAMNEFYFPAQRSVENDSPVARAATLLAEGKKGQMCWPQVIRCRRGNLDVEQEFYTESRAYGTRKNGEYEPKVITLVFLKEPGDEG